jgi:hypothetical protein
MQFSRLVIPRSDASSVKASLLDDGVVDTLGSVGATSGVHTCASINAGQDVNPFAQLFKTLVNQHSVTHGDGNRPQQYKLLGNIRELLSKPSPSRQTDTKV